MFDYILLAAILILQVLDVITTQAVLAAGGREANPIMRLAMDMLGDRWWLVKMLAVLPVVGLAFVGGFTWALVIILGLMAVVVGHNLWQLLK